MDRKQLGRSSLAVTPIGLGAWAIGGGDWILGWGPQSDALSVATLRHALESGINWIDTSAVYGLGHSEAMVARALRGLPRTDRPYVFTKCGLVWDELGNVSRSLEPRVIRREADGSLRRLEVEAIDLYQLDLPDGQAGSGQSDHEAVDRAWATMAALQREGKVRFLGVSNGDVHQLTRLEKIAPITSLQAPYSLLRREIEQRTLPFCATRGIGVIAYSPMASGLLTGAITPERLRWLPRNDWRCRSARFKTAALGRAPQLVERLRAVGAHHACVPGAVAIAWALRHPAVTGAAVGARRPEQVDELIKAASLRLPSHDVGIVEQDVSAATMQDLRT